MKDKRTIMITNQTQIFNIYGITEVSSWASCQRININSITEDHVHKDLIPIGELLTEIRLQDDKGGLVANTGQGNIWIGGLCCVCLLEGESNIIPWTWRNSGDIEYRDKDGNLFVLERTDRQIKRSGHRINIDYIQQVICQSSRISTCAAFTHFISSSNTSVTHLPQTQLIAVVPIVSDEFVLKHLTQEINTIISTDHFVIVDILPINSIIHL